MLISNRKMIFNELLIDYLVMLDTVGSFVIFELLISIFEEVKKK